MANLETAIKLAARAGGKDAMQATGTLFGLSAVAQMTAGAIKRVMPSSKDAAALQAYGDAANYAGSQTERLSSALNGLGTKIHDVTATVKHNAASLLAWGTVGGLTAKALIGLSEGADRVVESYYSMGESFSRTNKSMFKAFKDSWNVTKMEEWVEMAAARMNMPADAVKGMYEKLTRSVRTFYGPNGKIRYDILSDTMRQVAAFSRITGASIDQSADLYARLTNQYGKTHKQVISGMQTIAQAGREVNEELHDMGKDGGVALEDLVGIVNDAAGAFDGFTLNVEHLAVRTAHAIKVGQQLGMTYNESVDAAKQMTSIFAKPGGYIGFQAGEQLRQQVEDATKGITDVEQRAAVLSKKFGINVAQGRTLDIAASGPNAQMNTMEVLKGTEAGMETQFKMMQEQARNNSLSLDVFKQFVGGENLSPEQAGALMQMLKDQSTTFRDFKRRVDISKPNATAEATIKNSVFTPTMVKEWLKTASPALQIKAAAIIGSIKVGMLVAGAMTLIPIALGLARTFKSIPKFVGKLDENLAKGFSGYARATAGMRTSVSGVAGGIGKTIMGGVRKVGNYVTSAYRHVARGGVMDLLSAFIRKVGPALSSLTTMFRTGRARALVKVASAKEWAAGLGTDIGSRLGSVKEKVSTLSASAYKHAQKHAQKMSGLAAMALQEAQEVQASALSQYQALAMPGAAKSAARRAAVQARWNARRGVRAAQTRVVAAKEALAALASRAPQASVGAQGGAVDAFDMLATLASGPEESFAGTAATGASSGYSDLRKWARARKNAASGGPGGAKKLLGAFNDAAEKSGLNAGLGQLGRGVAVHNSNAAAGVKGGALRGLVNWLMRGGSLPGSVSRGAIGGLKNSAINFGMKAGGAAAVAGSLYSLYTIFGEDNLNDKGLDNGEEGMQRSGTRKYAKEVADRQAALEGLSKQIDIAGMAGNQKEADMLRKEYDRQNADLKSLNDKSDSMDDMDRHNSEIHDEIDNMKKARDQAKDATTKRLLDLKIKGLQADSDKIEKKLEANGMSSSWTKDKQGWFGGMLSKAAVVGSSIGGIVSLFSRIPVISSVMRAVGSSRRLLGSLARPLTHILGKTTAGKILGSMSGGLLKNVGGMLGKLGGGLGGGLLKKIPVLGSLISGGITAFNTEGSLGKKLFVGAGSMLGSMAGGLAGTVGGGAVGTAVGGPLGTTVGGFLGGMAGSGLGSTYGEKGANTVWDKFFGDSAASKSGGAPVIRPAIDNGSMAGTYSSSADAAADTGFSGGATPVRARGYGTPIAANGSTRLILTVSNFQDLIQGGMARTEMQQTGQAGGK